MEKTLAIHLQEQREQIAQEIEQWGIVTYYEPRSEIGIAQDSAFRQARSTYAAIARGQHK